MLRTGVDIIEIERVKRLIDGNEEFLDRIFTKEEIKYCNSKKNKYQHFAARFAAKESVIKALNDKNINLNKICTLNDKNGKPYIIMKTKIYSNISDKISISISHSKKYAIAFVVIL
jgi:holo-[acyl-carrier protein] synthase